MTELKCSVTSCGSNKQQMCTLHSINVDGATAHCKDDTCCHSFHDRSSAPTNSMDSGTPSMETEVRCQAIDCQYNDAKACNASYIYVQGSGTNHSNDTRCDTFKPRA